MKSKLSILLTIAMIMALIPMTAFAAVPVTPLDPSLVMYATNFTVGDIVSANFDPYSPESQIDRLNPSNALGLFDAIAPEGVSDFFFATAARNWSHFTFADKFMNVDGAPDIEFAEVTWGVGGSWHTEAMMVYLTGAYIRDINGNVVPYGATDDGIGYYAGIAWNRIGLEYVDEAIRLAKTQSYFPGTRDFADNVFYRSGDYGTFTQFHLPDEVVYAEGIYLVDITKNVYDLAYPATYLNVPNGNESTSDALVTLNSNAWDIINYTKITANDVIAVYGSNGNTDGYDLDAIRVYKYTPPQTYQFSVLKTEDITGVALEGWDITLYKVINKGTLEEDLEFIKTGTTDANGMYTFDMLEAGEYFVQETLKSNWIQVSPDNNPLDPNEGFYVTLPDDDLEVFNFVNALEKYGFCGYKLDSDTGLGLVGWTIILRDVEGNEIRRTTTGIGGRYCFGDLPAGTYTVEEVGQEGWEQVFPVSGTHTVTLPEESMIFGIERTANRPILKIDPMTGDIQNIFETDINSFSMNGPNGLAFDSGSGTFYYVTYPYNSAYGNATLFRYVLGETAAEELDTLDHEIACADFYDGKYYYIAGGPTIGATDDLYEVVFDGVGNVIAVNEFPGISSPYNYNWTFSGDIAISPAGVIYGVGINAGKYQFFSVERDGSNFSLINPNIGMPLQLAFSRDGVLFGNNLSDNSFYTVDLTNGSTIKTATSKSRAAFNDMASGIQYYNFENRTTLGDVPAFKFYDANLNGMFDEGETPIEGWKIQIYKGDLLIDTKFTDVNGEVMFTVPYGEYTIKEVMPLEKCWIATTPMEETITVERAVTNDRVEFGNVCLGQGGGKTLGFWSNKNGEKVFNGTDKGVSSLAMLRALNLRNQVGENFDPTTYKMFRTWLLDGNATNMSYMLSVQLAAMELNVTTGLVNAEALIYVPKLIGIANPLGFASVYDVMAAANVELGLHGIALSADEWRSYQENLKNALDYANNNMNFLQLAPCSITY